MDYAVAASVTSSAVLAAPKRPPERQPREAASTEWHPSEPGSQLIARREARNEGGEARTPSEPDRRARRARARTAEGRDDE